MKPDEIPKLWRILLLVDWPHIDIIKALIHSGFRLYTYSPEGYAEVSKKNDAGEPDFISLEVPPADVDIVVIYRPQEEHREIIHDHALRLNAKAIWLQPPYISRETQRIAEEAGLHFIQGHDIRELITG